VQGEGTVSEKRCRYCGRPEEGNPGDYYHEKQCERRDILLKMEAPNLSDSARERLERRLHAASYTGD